MAAALASHPNNELRSARPSRRRLYWFLAIVAAVFGCVFAILLFSDAPPPDLSDLAFEPVKVADEDNLYLQVIARGKELSAASVFTAGELTSLVPRPTPSAAIDPIRPHEQPKEGEGWTPEILAARKADVDAIVQEAHELRRHTLAQGSIPKNYRDHRDIGSLQTFGSRVQLATWALYRRGDQSAAVELALEGLRIGKAIRDSRGAMLDHIIGIKLITAFQKTIQRMASKPSATPYTLSRLLSGIRDIEMMPDGFEHTIRNDFRLATDYLAKLDAEEAEKDAIDQGVFKALIRTRVLFPLIYKPNATIDLYADLVRKQIRLSRLSPKDWPAKTPEPNPASLRRPWNAYGQTLVADNEPQGYYTPVHQMRWSVHVRQKALQTYIALRLHHLETGRLPETLDELVPRYLPAVPIDDIDSAPLRYSPVYRAIWSHGFSQPTGLVISSADQKVPESEVFYRLDFAAPPAPPALPETTEADTKKAPPETGP